MPKPSPPPDSEADSDLGSDAPPPAKPAKPAKPAPRPVVPSGPRRETGPATLGLTADPATPWTVHTGDTTKLRFTVVNTGGPARGLWVEVSGQAVTGGHAAGVRASSGEVAILAPRAVLAGTNLDAAEIRDTKDKLPPGPKPTATLEVEVRGVTKGKALLTVRVGVMTPKGPASSGSALCGRTLDVTE
jgi:hypothetical protein